MHLWKPVRKHCVKTSDILQKHTHTYPYKMWVLSQARFFIDPHKMPESTLTVVAQWDCRVNINQQEQWLIDPLLPYSPPHHHVLLPCPTSPLPAMSVDFIPSIFSADVSKLDQKPVGTGLQFTHCIKMYLRLGLRKSENIIIQLWLSVHTMQGRA